MKNTKLIKKKEYYKNPLKIRPCCMRSIKYLLGSTISSMFSNSGSGSPSSTIGRSYPRDLKQDLNSWWFRRPDLSLSKCLRNKGFILEAGIHHSKHRCSWKKAATNTHLNIMLNSLRASSVTPVVFLKGNVDKHYKFALTIVFTLLLVLLDYTQAYKISR